MGRSPCCAKEGLNRGAWTAMEDKTLVEYIKLHGEGKWRSLPMKAGLKRCGKSCRLRWLNYLKPDIKRGNITRDEEDLIIRLHNLLGNRWSLIAGRLPGRTDNEIKNYWNTNIGKKINNTTSNNEDDNNNEDYHHRRPDFSPSGRTTSKLIPKKKKKKKKNIPTAGSSPPSTHHQPARVGLMHHNSSSPTVPVPAAIHPIPSNVVRTKATRCTRVFINSHQFPLRTTDPNPQIRSRTSTHHHTVPQPHENTIITPSPQISNDGTMKKKQFVDEVFTPPQESEPNKLDNHNDLKMMMMMDMPRKPEPNNNDLMPIDMDDITDGFLDNVMDAAADFSPFGGGLQDYTFTDDAHHHHPQAGEDPGLLDRHLSSSLDDDGLFFKDDDEDMMMSMMMNMQAVAADAGDLDINNNNDSSNNWFASFLGVDIDFDHPGEKKHSIS